MAKKDIDPKKIEKALETFLKNPDPAAVGELIGKDYFLPLEKRLAKHPEKHVAGALELLRADSGPKVEALLRKLAADPTRALESRIECLVALATKGADLDAELLSRLKEIDKIASKDDAKGAAKLYPSLDKSLKDAFATAIVDRKAAKALEAAIEAETDPAGLKFLKRAAHLLRSRGVEIAEIAERGEAVYKPPEKQEESALVSHIDVSGKRLAYVISPGGMGAVFVFQAVIDELDGLVDFQAVETNRRGLAQFLKKAGEEHFVNVDPVYSSYLMDKAAALAREKGAIVSPEYLAHRAMLPAIPSGYELFDPREKIGEPPTRALAADAYEKLIGAGMYPWLPDIETMKVLKVKLDEVAESKIIVGDSQRMETMKRTLTDSVEDYLKAGGCERLIDRLTEEARLFVARGEALPARTALAAVDELKEYSKLSKQGDVVPPPPHFAMAMFETAFPPIPHPSEAPKSDKPGIVMP